MTPKEKKIRPKVRKNPGLPDFESRQRIRDGSWNVFLNRNPYFRIVPSPGSHQASKSVGK